MVEQIDTIIDNLAEKLGVAVSEIYSVVKAQVGVEIVKSLFSGILCIIGLALCWLYVKKVFIEKDGDGETILQKADEDMGFAIVAHVFLAIGVSVLAIIMVLALVGYVRTIIQCTMNPEYWALSRIFELVRGS